MVFPTLRFGPRRALIAAALLAWGQAAAADDGNQVFDRFGPARGIPNANVTAALQTHDGYLWLATGGGLVRFDGIRFTVFRPSNAPAFLDPLILSLKEDHEGDLWIGTGRGLLRRHAGVFSRIGLEAAAVAALAEDRAGRIWIGTHEQGLQCWESGRLRAASEVPLPDNFVTCLAVDGRDALWIGTGSPGVVRLQGGRAERLFIAGEIGDHTSAIAEYPDGTLWFGSHDGNLFRVRVGSIDRFGAAEGLPRREVTDLRPGGHGGLWVAAGGLYFLADPAGRRLRALPGLPVQNLAQVFEDREGTLWLCAREDGLIRSRTIPYRSIGLEQGLPGGEVRTVAEDADGNLWAAMFHHGMIRAGRDGSVETFSLRDICPNDDPSVAYPAGDDRVWIGGPGPLQLWRNGEPGTAFAAATGVRGIFRDRSGAFWFGTDDHGVFRWQSGALSPVEVNGRSIPHATSFAEDHNGTLYIGSWSEGLFRVTAKSMTAVAQKDGLPSNEIRSVLVDREDRLWVGFRSHGLALWADNRWCTSDAIAEAVADHVSGIIDDDDGRLWLGTAAGVFWAEKAGLVEACRHGVAPTLHFAGLGDAVPPVQTWSGAQPVAWRMADGRLAFASRQGIFLADPRHLPTNPVPPPVLIESILADRATKDVQGTVTLPAGTRQLSISYTAPSFVNANRVAFRYQLNGYDRDWVDAGDRRSAAYGSLPPGRYRFQVKASNSDGVWNDSGAGLEIVQAPWFYQTRWFGGALVLAAAAASWGLYRWSHRRLRARLDQLEQRQATERERQRIARHLHDDLGANLTEIGLFAEAARRRQTLPAALEDVEVLSERVREMIESLDAIVWAVNPANDSLDQLATYLSEYFQQLFSRSAIRCRLEVADDLPACPLTPDERSDVFLAAKEAMHNILKHSGATEARLELRMEAGRFHLVLTDNGRGFDSTAVSRRRNGLSNMRSRVAGLKGELRVESAPNQGTRLTLIIPFDTRLSPSCPPPSPLSKTTPP